MTRTGISPSGSVWFSRPKSAILSPNLSLHCLNTSRYRCNRAPLMMVTNSVGASVRSSAANRSGGCAQVFSSPLSSFQAEEKTSFLENRCFSRKSFSFIRLLLSGGHDLVRQPSQPSIVALALELCRRKKNVTVFFKNNCTGSCLWAIAGAY